MKPDSLSAYYEDYMKVPIEDRMNLEQSLCDRIGYYASDNEHPDPKHPLHDVPGRPTLKKKKQGCSQTSAARPGSSRADTSTKTKVATKTREDA